MPVSVLVTWESELKRWAPSLRVCVFHDAGRTARLRYLSTVQRQGGILLTTYGTVASSAADLATDVNKGSVFLTVQDRADRLGPEFVWDYLVLDEAHKIKNPAAKTTKSVLSISSRHRILLTGTAVQNNLQELWSLYNCTHNGRLLGRMQTFKMEYERPITKAREKDANRAERTHGQLMAQSLRKLIDPYFLRRTKADVLSSNKNASPQTRPISTGPSNQLSEKLPKKTELVVWIFLQPIQVRTYRDFLELDQIKELLMGSTRRSPLMELVILKKLCDHPRLLSPDQCSNLNLDANQSTTEDNNSNRRPMPSATRLAEESGKLLFLRHLARSFLKETASGKPHPPRCLVFSQSLRLLDMAEKVLLATEHQPDGTNQTYRHRVLRLDGRLSKVEERLKIMQLFERDKSYTAMLLTTQVGGVGLTLTAANRVIILDPSWNPATDAQAVDRAYRIGQQSDVLVYRLITCGTVEEKIYRRQIFKDSVIRQTTCTGQNKSDNDPYRYFTRQDLYELFSLSDPRVSKTQQQLANLHGDDEKWSDESLQPHLCYLTSDELKHTVFGLSFHDLMFTRSEHAEHQPEEPTAGEQQFLLNRRVAAEHAIARECAHSAGALSHDLANLHMKDNAIAYPRPNDRSLLIPSQTDTKRPMFNRPHLGDRPVPAADAPVVSSVPVAPKFTSVIEIEDSDVADTEQLVASLREMSISHAIEASNLHHQSPELRQASDPGSAHDTESTPDRPPHSATSLNNSATKASTLANASPHRNSSHATPSPPLSYAIFGNSMTSKLPRSTPLTMRHSTNAQLQHTPLVKSKRFSHTDAFIVADGIQATEEVQEVIHMDITATVDEGALEMTANMKSMHEILTKSGLLNPCSTAIASHTAEEFMSVIADSYTSAGEPLVANNTEESEDVEIIEDSLIDQTTD